MAGVDYGMLRFAEAEVREGLSHQMEVMRADADRRGGAALVAELNAQARNRDARRYLLLVEAPDGSTFSNGLTRLAVNGSGFRRNLPTKARQTRWPDQAPNMLVLSDHAADGALLAVGRDIQHLDELRAAFARFGPVERVQRHTSSSGWRVVFRTAVPAAARRGQSGGRAHHRRPDFRSPARRGAGARV